jgi:translation elongation factor EF-Tu-like GTPase
MGQPAYPVSVAVVPLLGPDGVGKTWLLNALGGYVQQRDGLPSPPLREVFVPGSSATVLDVRTARGFTQLVDFPSAAAAHGLLGASPFQGAVLVVSALDSVLPGTVESLMAARQAGIMRIAVALTQCDRVDDPELLDLVTMEIRSVLDKYECRGDAAPVVSVAASGEGRAAEKWRAGLGQLLDGVQRLIG